MSSTYRPSRGRLDRVSIEVLFPSESTHLADWEARWRRGEVPSRWPYGLDELAWYADEVALVGVPRATRAHRVGGRLVRPLFDRWISRRPGRDIGLTWDEQTCIRMVARRRYAEMYSGVIWLTDRIERGETRHTDLMVSALRQMTGTWVLSEAQIAPLANTISPVPVRFAGFGVDEEFFCQQPWPQRPAVVSVGSDRDRDWDTLTDAMTRVHEARPEIDIAIQGGREKDLPIGVRRLPRVPLADVPELYRDATVVALAMRHNLHVSGMTVGLEAHASGRPVVATGTPGCEAYFAAGLDSTLVPIGDSEALAAAVLELLANEPLAREYGAQGRASVEAGGQTSRLVSDLARGMDLARRETMGHLDFRLGEKRSRWWPK